ncbi:hypothetical protein [Algoriphagus winogradskyi]|uniref:Uncharacterized protein n=1 Tax=Algoriphagus winogradskyi TaxID=237017 RepID=A0ABY1P683_9BACT|nr:hypothetical protein [Algoriphagus winogradskyi]SMP27485.1 hypothetical protein SAMN06265367_10579 [Algoriphagus winogradskyi]
MSDSIQNNQDSIITEIQNRLSEIDSNNQIILNIQEKVLSELATLNITLVNSNEFQLLWIGAILGAFLGLLLSKIASWIGKKSKYRRFKKLYSKYSGVYLAYKKYDRENKSAYRCFILKQDKNMLLIENGISVIGNEDFNGMITMDENNFNHGKGHFQHNPNSNGEIGFGFLEIQLANDVILVHETIYNKNGGQNSDAFRWIKQSDSDSKKITEKYREFQLQNSRTFSIQQNDGRL